MLRESSSDSSVEDIPTVGSAASSALDAIETPNDHEEVFSEPVSDDPPAAMATPDESREAPPPSEAPPAVEADPELPPPGANPPTSHPRVFTIAWSAHSVVRQVRRIWMAESTDPIFFARPTGPMGIPSTWLITERDVSVAQGSHDVIAVLAHGRSSFVSRRWLLRCGDNEVLGFAFYDIDGRRRGARAFRVVIPRATPYQSTSPETDLSALARAGEVDENFLMCRSKLPIRKPNGRVALPFGPNIIVRPSVKNFIVENAEGEQVFVIYKSSDETCTVRIKAPITPLFAFALGIAIVATGD